MIDNTFINEFPSFLSVRFEDDSIPYQDFNIENHKPIGNYIGKTGNIYFGNIPIAQALLLNENGQDILEILELDNNLNDPNIFPEAELEVEVELAKAKISIEELKTFTHGSVVKLDRLINEPLTFLVQGTAFAKGEVIMKDENFGFRITSLVDEIEPVCKVYKNIHSKPILNSRVILGSKKITLKEITELKTGSVVILDKKIFEPVQLVFENQEILNGEVIELGEYFGIRIISNRDDGELLKNRIQENEKNSQEQLEIPVQSLTLEEYIEFAKGNIEKVVNIIKIMLTKDFHKNVGMLILALPDEIGISILQNLSDSELEKVFLDISRSDLISENDLRLSLQEFSNIKSSLVLHGGIDSAKALMQKAIGSQKTTEIFNNLTSTLNLEVTLDSIQNVDPMQLLNLLQNEHPQTIALVLSHLETKKAALIVTSLPHTIQAVVIKRLATMTNVSSDVLRRVENVLNRKLSLFALEDNTKNYFELSTEILRTVDVKTGRTVIEALEEDGMELAEEFEKRMYVLEDIVSLDDRAIQKVLREVDNNDLAMALRGTTNEEVHEKIFKNMSKRAGALLREDMEFVGPVRMVDAEDSQQKIINIIKNLSEVGEIVVPRLAGEEIVESGLLSQEDIDALLGPA